MSKVKLIIIESRCRGGYSKAGDVYIVEDLCPPYVMNYEILFIPLSMLCKMVPI